MARIRTIKPEFPQSESMGRCSRDARLLFVMLWTVCDDEGRTRANSRMLASLLFPYDNDAFDKIPGWLDELHTQNCIEVYEIDDHTYLQVKNWTDHQKIDRPSKSKFPPSPQRLKRKPKSTKIRETVVKPRDGDTDVRDSSPRPREGSSLDQGPGSEEGTKDLLPFPNGNGRNADDPPKAKPPKLIDPWKQVYDRGKEILGREAGGIITLLRKFYEDKPRKVLAKLEDAAEQREPLKWICAFLHNADDGGRLSGEYIGGVPP